jgi:hypothetical protein
MLRRPLIVALVIGTAVPIMAVQRVTIGLLASSTLSFLFVIAIQLAVGALLIASAASRRVGMSRALDLWFAAHVPYSLWLLVAAAAIAAMPSAGLDGLIAVAIVRPRGPRSSWRRSAATCWVPPKPAPGGAPPRTSSRCG